MKRLIALCMLLLLAAAGCRKANTDVPAPTAAPTAAPAAEVSVEPAAGAPAEPAGYAFTFSAQTLEGETVTEAFLGQYDLTMVNVWTSWCPPCRGELPELAALYSHLPENVGFLSVTMDEPEDLETAAALLSENGCPFPCLDGLGSEGLWNSFLHRVMAIPTTLFLDRNGNEVGQWIVGVPQGSGSVADAYLSEIQTRLDLLNGK